MIFLLFLIDTSVFASGSLNAGKSNPANLVVYCSKGLSTEGYWDLSDYKFPAKVVIKFNGELPEQKWKLRYKVKDFKYEGSYFAIIPQLIIYYEFKKDKED